MRRVVHWFRRDLRVTDNTALAEAIRRSEIVTPLFVFEDAWTTGPDVGAARLEFLLRSLEALRENLARLGYDLIVRRGRSEAEVPRLCQELQAEAVFCNRRYEPYAQARDDRVCGALHEIGVGFECFKDAVIWEERDLLSQAGDPYTVFTPYARAWRKGNTPQPRPGLKLAGKKQLPAIPCDKLPATAMEAGYALAQSIPPAGEQAAHATLKCFLADPVFEYSRHRDHPAIEGTSQLSPHLRCGTIGIRTVMAELSKARAKASPEQQLSCDTFQTELIWREFYLQILANFPHVMKGSFRPQYDALAWSDNRDHFTAWCHGQTGYPIVDAAMRSLKATGWMHNRLRMITAMFLTKDLLLNWQWGERYFMHQLVDGDMAANNGGWQWSAGTGTDAAPYFRIFNPVTQGLKCDPNGAFVRKWVPELAGLPGKSIHEPWKAPSSLAINYQQRIVLHEEQRPKCLAMYSAVTRRHAPKS
jgi:deoxyribodipyrimidine photo-lyase